MFEDGEQKVARGITTTEELRASCRRPKRSWLSASAGIPELRRGKRDPSDRPLDARPRADGSGGPPRPRGPGVSGHPLQRDRLRRERPKLAATFGRNRLS